MSVVVLLGAASGGVSTTSAALWWCWPRCALLVEADPVGAAHPAGLLGERAGGADGLLGQALAAGRGTLDAEELTRHTVAVDAARHRLLAVGVSEPAQYAAVAGAAERLSAGWEALGGGDPPVDVLVDAGRVLSAPPGLLAGADHLLLVVRGTLPAAAAARRWLPSLAQARPVAVADDDPRLRLLVVGETPYTAGELTAALGVPVAGVLPWDPRGAAALADAPAPPRSWRRSVLARAAAELTARLCRQASAAPTPPRIDAPATGAAPAGVGR